MNFFEFFDDILKNKFLLIILIVLILISLGYLSIDQVLKWIDTLICSPPKIVLDF